MPSRRAGRVVAEGGEGRRRWRTRLPTELTCPTSSPNREIDLGAQHTRCRASMPIVRSAQADLPTFQSFT